MVLFSFFGSWAAQQLNPFLQCLAALTQKNPLGQFLTVAYRLIA